MSFVRIVIADRNPFVLRGLTRLIDAEENFKVVAGCRNSTQCIQAIRNDYPDIVLIDILASGISGLDILAITTGAGLPARLVFHALSAELREQIIASANHPYDILLNETLLMHCLRSFAAEKDAQPPAPTADPAPPPARSDTPLPSLARLTEREREIAHMVSEELSNREIGQRLNISEGTIKVHLHHIYDKLAIGNRAALAALAAPAAQRTSPTA
jgi:two-component system nitrate/nitrite response regulator NarL